MNFITFYYYHGDVGRWTCIAISAQVEFHSFVLVNYLSTAACFHSLYRHHLSPWIIRSCVRVIYFVEGKLLIFYFLYLYTSLCLTFNRFSTSLGFASSIFINFMNFRCETNHSKKREFCKGWKFYWNMPRRHLHQNLLTR